jgi:hypothetical protein
MGSIYKKRASRLSQNARFYFMNFELFGKLKYVFHTVGIVPIIIDGNNVVAREYIEVVIILVDHQC